MITGAMINASNHRFMRDESWPLAHCGFCGCTPEEILDNLAPLVCTVSPEQPEPVVVPFKTKDGTVGDGITLSPDGVLDSAKGQFEQVVVFGFTPDGEPDLRCSHGSRDALWMLQRAIFHLMLETE